MVLIRRGIGRRGKTIQALDRRQLRALVDRGLEGHFLCRPVELPPTEPARQQRCREGCQRDPPPALPRAQHDPLAVAESSMKIVILMALAGVLVALASAGFFMLRKSDESQTGGRRDKRMARALALRVGLSIALFLFILVAWKMGWIAPSGIPTGR